MLMSVGRRPNSEIPGLDKTKVKVNARDSSKLINNCRRLILRFMRLAMWPESRCWRTRRSHEGRTAVEAIAGHKVAFEPNAIPAVVFTDPEIAWAGLTETQAKEQGREVTVASSRGQLRARDDD